ncbi:hypothetical protein L9F63_010814, partial [Diploptera punctata]
MSGVTRCIINQSLRQLRVHVQAACWTGGRSSSIMNRVEVTLNVKMLQQFYAAKPSKFDPRYTSITAIGY